MKLYYLQPAGSFEEALPVGNGSLGGLMLGGVCEERITLNEESVWSGFPEDKTKPGTEKYLQQVRQLIAQERYYEAEEIVKQNMLGKENESYLPLGTLKLRYTYGNEGETKKETEYRRYLDLERAVAGVTYTKGGVEYTRELFASYPQQALYLRLTSKSILPVLDILFESQLKITQETNKEGMYIHLKAPEHVAPAARAEAPFAVVWGDRGMELDAQVELLYTDGTCMVEEKRLRIENSKEIVLRFSAVRTPGRERCYQEALLEHASDYRRLYTRMTLSLGPQLKLPTDERLKRLARGEEDPGLYGLYFQYGRYLLISSSRPGSLPSNLQGIWSWQMHAPWRSNWTTNINLEMNYWPVHSCNLWECFEPYIEFMQKICENGSHTAAVNYGCRGFVVHHNVDGWYSTTPTGITWEGKEQPEAAGWGMWPMGGVWLTELLFWHYDYTQDSTYLQNQAYPVIKQAVLFILDWLYEEDGIFHTCPSTSPENRFWDEEGRSVSISRSTTMDVTLIRMLLMGYLEVCGILGYEEAISSQVKDVLDRLAKPKISPDGRLFEWEKDHTPTQLGHRHISHLYGLFPGKVYDQDEKMKEACRKSLSHRLNHGGGHTGWSLAWILNIYAMLGDGEKFGEALNRLLTHSTYPNLWDAHPPFQIDGNFGGIAAIANMLAYERNGQLHLLSALPPMFRDGYVRGLCLPGRRFIDLAWKDGMVQDFRMYS